MLIGITGKAGSGKDSVADYLRKHHDFAKMSFAAPLKDLVEDLFNMSKDQLHTSLKEEIDTRYGVSPRYLLQYIGTDVFRKLYPNIWADYLSRKYEQLNLHGGKTTHIVVSDVRFLNEAKAINLVRGFIVRVVCPDNPKDLGEVGSSHASEKEQDDIVEDFTLTASYGELPFLFKQVDELMKAIDERIYV